MSDIKFKMFDFDFGEEEYTYNDETGLIFIKEFNLNNSYMMELDKFVNNLVIESNNLIKDNIIDIVPNQLILKVTEACNMRCKYCIYSEYYSETKSYSNLSMTFEVANAGIDIYMNKIIENYESTAIRIEPIISFYGGEPLLEFKLIKSIVDYVHKRYSDFIFKFAITTNGLLLNEQISYFFISNKFIVTISLDGDIKNNDRNRVDTKGQGTYDRIVNNIKLYFLNYTRVNISSCYDYKTNFNEFSDYIEKNNVVNGGWMPILQRLSLIDDIDTDYYTQFSEVEIENYLDTMKKMRLIYKDNAINSKKQSILTEVIIGNELMLLYDRMKLLNSHNYYSTTCTNCVPGQKLFLTANGNFYICEK